MIRVLSHLRSGAKRLAFLTATRLSRLDPSGNSEARLRANLLKRLGNNPQSLRNVARLSEERGDKLMALAAWMRVLRMAPKQSDRVGRQARRKLAELETGLRREVQTGQPAAADPIPGLPPAPALRAAAQPAARPLPRAELRHYRAWLDGFWQNDLPALSDPQQNRVRQAYLTLAQDHRAAGRHQEALSALQPVLATWPEVQEAWGLYLQSLLDCTLAAEPAEAEAMLAEWWAFVERRRDALAPSTLDRLLAVTQDQARRQQKTGNHAAAERLILPTFNLWPDNTEALLILARGGENRGDWREAAAHLQLAAAITNPVSTKSGTIVAKDSEERLRQTGALRTRLRRARTQLALQVLAEGRKREFCELASRVVESLPDHRILKFDRPTLDVAGAYLRLALEEDGVTRAVPPAAPDRLRRVVICLDILKVSAVHTHSRVVFTMCRNLLRHDPGLEIHLVITNERFAVTTPVLASSFNPLRDDEVIALARSALGEFYDRRFHMQFHRDAGLEGVVRSCKAIVALQPDLLMYGGGHRGLFSNESRLVRHALYDLFPTAFFYIQANNEVDEKNDMIIARGPHAIEGDPGAATIRVQPYPTIVEENLVAAQAAPDPEKARGRIIVSAITGVRMDVRLKEFSVREMNDFFSILDAHPGAVWHFVGATNPAEILRANRNLATRVKAGQVVLHPVLPFDDFCALVGRAALFLHLPGFTGGSGGAAVARRAAIPILTFNHSDVSGRQPPAMVFETTDTAGFAAKAIALLGDEQEWIRGVEAQIAHTDWIRATSVQGFHDCLAEAVRLGAQRLAREAG